MNCFLKKSKEKKNLATLSQEQFACQKNIECTHFILTSWIQGCSNLSIRSMPPSVFDEKGQQRLQNWKRETAFKAVVQCDLEWADWRGRRKRRVAKQGLRLTWKGTGLEQSDWRRRWRPWNHRDFVPLLLLDQLMLESPPRDAESRERRSSNFPICRRLAAVGWPWPVAWHQGQSWWWRQVFGPLWIVTVNDQERVSEREKINWNYEPHTHSSDYIRDTSCLLQSMMVDQYLGKRHLTQDSLEQRWEKRNESPFFEYEWSGQDKARVEKLRQMTFKLLLLSRSADSCQKETRRKLEPTWRAFI